MSLHARMERIAQTSVTTRKILLRSMPDRVVDIKMAEHGSQQAVHRFLLRVLVESWRLTVPCKRVATVCEYLEARHPVLYQEVREQAVSEQNEQKDRDSIRKSVVLAWARKKKRVTITINGEIRRTVSVVRVGTGSITVRRYDALTSDESENPVVCLSINKTCIKERGVGWRDGAIILVEQLVSTYDRIYRRELAKYVGTVVPNDVVGLIVSFV